MLIKKETEYAAFGLLELSKHGDGFTDVRLIAKKKKIPAELLSKIFQRLNRAKLIESRTGPSGGFRLKKPLKHINLLNVMEVVQQKNILKCYAGEAQYCKSTHCPFKKVTRGIEEHLDKYLSKITLHDLAQKY